MKKQTFEAPKVDDSKNKELITKTEVEGTPFIVVTTKNGSFATIGRYRLTEEMKSEKECIAEIKKITWNRIIQVVSLMQLILKEQDTLNTK